MALAINLRGDLAKLRDGELADRLADAWRRYDSIPGASSRWSGPTWALRGPIRHPRAYRFLMGLSALPLGGHWVDLLLPLVLSSKPTDRLMESNVVGEPYLPLCEIKDIMDEMQRRIDARKANTQ